MENTLDLETALLLISGIGWTIVYVGAIRIGFRHRSYAMPVAALALNLSWETTYAPFDLTAEPDIQNGINVLAVQGTISVLWAVLDIVILYTFLKFGRAEFPSFLTRPMFAAWTVLVLGTAYAVQWLFIAEFGVDEGSRYSAFLQNLLMSGLFIAMLVARRGLRGQTLTIAIAKWVGTLAATIIYGILEDSTIILGLGLLCFVFDLVYIGLVGWAKARPQALANAPARTAEAVPA